MTISPDGFRFPGIPIPCSSPAPALRLVALLALAVVMATIGSLSPARAQDDGDSLPPPRYLQIGTGPTAGSYFPLGGRIARALSSPPGSRPCDKGGSCGVPGLIAVAQTTTGGVANLEALRAGSHDLALTQADIATDALTARGAFEHQQPFPRLRAIATVFQSSFHLMVPADSPIRRVEDLRGKKVSLGEQGSGTLVDGLLMIEAFGLKKTDLTILTLKPGTAAEAMEQGRIDAFFFVSSAPVPAVAALIEQKKGRLIPVEGAGAARLLSGHPLFQAGVIPADIYADHREIPTITLAAVLVCTDALPEVLVHDITAALFHPGNQKIFNSSALASLPRSWQAASQVSGLPLHPGAARFYEEQKKKDEQAASPAAEAGNQGH